MAVDNEATKALQILDDRWAAERWSDVVDTLIELGETRGRSVVQVQSGVAGGTARYGLVQSACDRLVAELPPEGLAAYRKRIDPTAQRWFRDWQQTGDVAALERIVRQAYYSRWGDEALWELGQAAWNRGDFLDARAWWTQLLPDSDGPRRYPDPEQPAADVAARCLLCAIFLHRVSVQDEFDRFDGLYGASPGRLAGRAAPWRELLTQVLRESESWPQTATNDEVPTFAGTQTRSAPQKPRGPAPAVDLGSELWSAPLAPVKLPEMPRATLFPPELPTPYHPAVVDGRVFLNEGNRLFAWDLATGRPAWGNGETDSAVIYPAVDDSLVMLPARPVSGGPCWTVTVQDGRLYARMGSPVTTPSPQELRDLPNELVCLDVADGQGRLLWKLTGEEFTAVLHEAGDAAPWSWEGSPVVTAGRVYAALSRRRPQLEWSVACLDAETGLLLWHRPVGISRPTPPDFENRASQLLLTLGDGRLFLSTEWGAIVAVDAAEGQLQWAVTYESQPLQTPAALALPRGSPPPCVFDNGRLYVAPTDAPFVFCLDASTGERRWQVTRGRQPAHLLGVAHGRLIVASHSLWALNADSGQVTWSVRQTEPDDFGYGRGWLAGDHIYWTSRQTAFVVDQRTGQVVREHPLGNAVSPRTGGNVVVSNGVLLIAGADRLTAYGQFARPLPAQPELLSQRLVNVLKDPNGEGEAPAEPQKTADFPTLRGSAGASPSPVQQTESRRRIAGGLPPRTPRSDQSPHLSVPLARPVSSNVASRLTNQHQTLAEPAAQPLDAKVVAVNRDQAVHNSLELSIAGYWRRAWQRPLEPGLRAHLPQGDSSSGVVLCQGRELEAWDRHTGQRRWTLPLPQPLLWSAYGTERLLLATTDEVCAVLGDTGRIVWRLPWRAALLGSAVAYPPSTSQVEFHRLPQGLLIVAPAAGFVWCDEQTGAVRKVQQATEPWRVDVSLAASQALVRGVHTGANHCWDFGTENPQRTPFLAPAGIRSVLHADADGWVVETDERELFWCAPTGQPTGAFVGTLSHAHADPLVLHANQTWALLIDGVTLTGLRADETERKWPTWSQALMPVPLRQPREQTVVIGSKIYAAGAGWLRAIDLATGEKEWEQPLALADPLRVVKWDTHSLAVLPHGAANEPVSRVTVFDATSGQPLQQVALTSPAREMAIHADRAGVVLVTERVALAVARR